VIDHTDVAAATARLNPQIAATNAVGEAFGNSEAVPMMRDIAGLADVDYDALMQFATDVLITAIEGSTRPSPKDYAEGAIQGFVMGVLAAREEADRG
jgi:hypothetical protein